MRNPVSAARVRDGGQCDHRRHRAPKIRVRIAEGFACLTDPDLYHWRGARRL